MRKVLLIFALLSTITAFSQEQDFKRIKPITPGDHLILATEHYYDGLVLTFIGSGLVYAGSGVLINDKQFNNSVTIFGGVVSLIGVGFIIESHWHSKRAGLLLNQNGIGVKIKL